eukprot:gb/GECG01007752.1/.p1 GENE.gb/GECG01007752.1/~~gb/GECG01007752.1/.p1  ORF type:complete len:1247 (+),score=146.21 gb/GECG01007752.1/:1-3741(+)
MGPVKEPLSVWGLHHSPSQKTPGQEDTQEIQTARKNGIVMHGKVSRAVCMLMIGILCVEGTRNERTSGGVALLCTMPSVAAMTTYMPLLETTGPRALHSNPDPVSGYWFVTAPAGESKEALFDHSLRQHLLQIVRISNGYSRWGEDHGRYGLGSAVCIRVKGTDSHGESAKSFSQIPLLGILLLGAIQLDPCTAKLVHGYHKIPGNHQQRNGSQRPSQTALPYDGSDGMPKDFGRKWRNEEPSNRRCHWGIIILRLVILWFSAFVLTAMPSRVGAGSDVDLRASIQAGIEPCFHYSANVNLFRMNCSVLNWNGCGYAVDTHISLHAQETFDGGSREGNIIDLKDVNCFRGLFKIVDDSYSNTSIDDAPFIRNVHTKNGITAEEGGFIVRKEQKHFIVDSCSSTGDITKNAGGICGRRAGCNGGHIKISNSFSTGPMLKTNAGGIAAVDAGECGGTVDITQCYSTGTIEGVQAGGIGGGEAGKIHGHVYITKSYSTGNIRGDNAGGITGDDITQDHGEIHIVDCYTRGNIDGTGAGGITGSNIGKESGNVTITNTYASGVVAASAGGIVGSIASGATGVRVQYSVYNGGDDKANTGITGDDVNDVGALQAKGNSDNLEDIRGQLYHYVGAQQWRNGIWALNGSGNMPILCFQLPCPTPTPTTSTTSTTKPSESSTSSRTPSSSGSTSASVSPTSSWSATPSSSSSTTPSMSASVTGSTTSTGTQSPTATFSTVFVSSSFSSSKSGTESRTTSISTNAGASSSTTDTSSSSSSKSACGSSSRSASTSPTRTSTSSVSSSENITSTSTLFISSTTPAMSISSTVSSTFNSTTLLQGEPAVSASEKSGPIILGIQVALFSSMGCIAFLTVAFIFYRRRRNDRMTKQANDPKELYAAQLGIPFDKVKVVSQRSEGGTTFQLPRSESASRVNTERSERPEGEGCSEKQAKYGNAVNMDQRRVSESFPLAKGRTNLRDLRTLNEKIAPAPTGDAGRHYTTIRESEDRGLENVRNSLSDPSEAAESTTVGLCNTASGMEFANINPLAKLSLPKTRARTCRRPVRQDTKPHEDNGVTPVAPLHESASFHPDGTSEAPQLVFVQVGGKEASSDSVRVVSPAAPSLQRVSREDSSGEPPTLRVASVMDLETSEMKQIDRIRIQLRLWKAKLLAEPPPLVEVEVRNVATDTNHGGSFNSSSTDTATDTAGKLGFAKREVRTARTSLSEEARQQRLREFDHSYVAKKEFTPCLPSQNSR